MPQVNAQLRLGFRVSPTDPFNSREWTDADRAAFEQAVDENIRGGGGHVPTVPTEVWDQWIQVALTVDESGEAPLAEIESVIETELQQVGDFPGSAYRLRLGRTGSGTLREGTSHVWVGGVQQAAQAFGLDRQPTGNTGGWTPWTVTYAPEGAGLPQTVRILADLTWSFES